MESEFPFVDAALALRLEATEGRGGADFVETRARIDPTSGATWTEIDGVYALFDGVASPVTQTFGLGLQGPPTTGLLGTIEQFFTGHGAPIFHEVSPLADPRTPSLLNGRGYEPFEFTSVLYRPIAQGLRLSSAPNPGIVVRVVGPADADRWVETNVRGWSEFRDFAPLMLELSKVGVARTEAVSFLAEIGGRPIAAAALTASQGVALLAGASTIPEARRQGAQLALLEHRLRYAAESGCDLAMMCAQPGSASQRNAERHGFRIAYTRIKWRIRSDVR